MIPARPTRRSAGTGLVCATRSDPQLFSFLGWVRLLEPVTPGELAAETGMPATTDPRPPAPPHRALPHRARAEPSGRPLVPGQADGPGTTRHGPGPAARRRGIRTRRAYLARPAAEYVER